MNDEESLYKVLVLGDVSAGKRSLILKFTDDSFFQNGNALYSVTNIRTVELNGVNVKFYITNNTSQERFRPVTKEFFPDLHGIIVVYDVTNNYSFEYCLSTVSQIAALQPPDNFGLLVIGTKCDLNNERMVEVSRAKTEVEKHGFTLFETSAKTGENVDGAFLFLAEEFLQRPGNSVKNANTAIANLEIDETPVETAKHHKEENKSCTCM